MTDDLGQLLGADGPGEAVGRLRDAVRAAAVVPGWGTVELDRAEGEVGARLGGDGAVRREDAPSDGLLGATARRLRRTGGQEVVLLEPDREGPLAAALARFGEGVVALYLLTDQAGADRARSAGFTLSAVGASPFGPARRVLVGPSWGPHLLLVTGDAEPTAATIEP